VNYIKIQVVLRATIVMANGSLKAYFIVPRATGLPLMLSPESL
jgi:hypothetical protein